MLDELKKLFLTFTQFPMVIGLWLWRDQAKASPAYTVLICLAYEVCVFTLTFSNKVWKKIEDRATQQAADWIINSVTSFALRFPSRYKRLIKNEYGIFNVRGLGLLNTYTLPLEHVFVDLRIDPSNPQKFNLNPIATKELISSRTIWEVLRVYDSTDFEAKSIAIIGPPGSGKTTLLQHVALTLATKRHRQHKIQARTPIFLSIRNHVNDIAKDNVPLGALVQHHFSDEKIFAGLAPPRGWFDKKLQKGSCLVLLDGLDEVAESEKRRQVSAWIDIQVKNYPRCRFIVTARPQGYREAPLERGDVLEVQPFTDRQVQTFVKNWYLANEFISSGGKDIEGIRFRAAKDAKDLLDRLSKQTSLYALTVNPLLLTMISMVHRYHGALPGSRIELYAEICEVLLGRWRQARGIKESLNARQKLVVLRLLAAFMMVNKRRDIKTKDVATIIELPLRRIGFTFQAEQFLEELQSGSGLFIERDLGVWSFAHLTFQEYLAAAHWLEQRDEEIPWGQFVCDSWWQETLRLYAAQGDATPIVEACMATDFDASAMALAADCLAEARELDPQVREETEAHLIASLDSSDRSIRSVAAKVMLIRRLRSLQVVDSRREIDPNYLTSAEYGLFLDDMRKEGKALEPDHWMDVYSSEIQGTAREPITGIRAEDAVSFCDWLCHQYIGANYRLPFTDEALKYPPQMKALATWCGQKGKYELVGLTEAAKQDTLRYLSKLSEMPLPDKLSFYFDFSLFKNEIAFTRNVRQIQSHITRVRHYQNFISSFKPREFIKTHDHDYGVDVANQIQLELYEELMKDLKFINEFNYEREFYDAIRLPVLKKYGLTDQSIMRLDEVLKELKQCVAGKSTKLNVQNQKTIKLIELVVKAFLASTWQEMRQLRRKFFIQIIKDAYSEQFGKFYEYKARRIHQYLSLDDRGKSDDALLLNLYWWLEINVARAEGNLIAWEGLRFVRERSI